MPLLSLSKPPSVTQPGQQWGLITVNATVISWRMSHAQTDTIESKRDFRTNNLLPGLQTHTCSRSTWNEQEQTEYNTHINTPWVGVCCCYKQIHTDRETDRLTHTDRNIPHTVQVAIPPEYQHDCSLIALGLFEGLTMGVEYWKNFSILACHMWGYTGSSICLEVLYHELLGDTDSQDTTDMLQDSLFVDSWWIGKGLTL